jgi:hypothetical protein
MDSEDLETRLNKLEANIRAQLELQKKLDSQLSEFFSKPTAHESTRILQDLYRRIAALEHNSNYSACPLAQTDTSLPEVLILKGQRKNAHNYLNTELEQAKSLIIADPHFLGGAKGLSSKFGKAIRKVIPISVKDIVLFVNISREPEEYAAQKPYIEEFKKFINSRKIALEPYPADNIHDRVWIKDSRIGYSVGTSFNGLGNKCAFILKLPEQDLEDFKKELTRITQTKPPLIL